MKTIISIFTVMTVFVQIAAAQSGPDYVCEFAEPLRKVNAKEWGVQIIGKQGDGTACVAKSVCTWNFKERLPPASWHRTPQEYDQVAACSKDADGSCGKSIEACSADETVSFFDGSISRKKLKIKEMPSGGVQ